MNDFARLERQYNRGIQWLDQNSYRTDPKYYDIERRFADEVCKPYQSTLLSRLEEVETTENVFIIKKALNSFDGVIIRLKRR